VVLFGDGSINPAASDARTQALRTVQNQQLRARGGLLGSDSGKADAASDPA